MQTMLIWFCGDPITDVQLPDDYVLETFRSFTIRSGPEFVVMMKVRDGADKLHQVTVIYDLDRRETISVKEREM